MGCGRSVRRQSAKSLADQQVWLWSIRYGLNWAGRIAVTEHIAGPRSVSVVAALAAGGGSCRPGCGFWWLLGWIKAVTGDRRSLHGRSLVGSERPGLYTLSGSVRPRRVVRFGLTSVGPRSWRTCGPRRLRRQSEPDLAATQRGSAAGTADGRIEQQCRRRQRRPCPARPGHRARSATARVTYQCE